MAKNSSESALTQESILQTAASSLKDQLGYTNVQKTIVEGEPCMVAFDNEHPVILVYVPENMEPISAAEEELATELGAVLEQGPADYVWATTKGTIGEGYMYSWLPNKDCQVSSIPNFSEYSQASEKGLKRIKPKVDPVKFKGLQHEFDELHERIYAMREPVDGANDIIAQICKCIFLKMHLEKYPDFKFTNGQLFEEIFNPDFIRSKKEKAVEYIRKAFDKAKKLDEYCLEDDRGHSFRIFDQADFIKFNRPETYAYIAEVLSNHRLRSPEETGLEDDILGRAFDVMLRAKFESKGGMGIYLTPQQVRDTMVQMAFHDIIKENPGEITRRDSQTNKMLFRACDPACGSAGFLVTAMREVRKHVDKLLGLSELQRAELLSDIFSQGFLGADSSPNMVLMGRINMALHGDPKARIFRVDNSLTSDVFIPESMDLILTNPPFKKGGIKDKELLDFYQSDIVDGDIQMSGSGLAMGSKPNSKGTWKAVKSVDPAVLFIDRCLQLLKPGGRLLIVLPDGILCNSGDRYVREYLMGTKDEETGQFIGGKAVVKAVVSLPPVTFRLSGAGAKTSFLYLQKKRPGDKQGPVFMAVANQVGFDIKQNKEIITGENDLIKILESYKSGPPSTDEDNE